MNPFELFLDLLVAACMLTSFYFLIYIPVQTKRRLDQYSDKLIREGAFEAVMLFKQAYQADPHRDVEYYINYVNEASKGSKGVIRAISSNTLRELLPELKSDNWRIYSVQVEPKDRDIATKVNISVFYVVDLGGVFVAYKDLVTILTLANISSKRSDWYHNEFVLESTMTYTLSNRF